MKTKKRKLKLLFSSLAIVLVVLACDIGSAPTQSFDPTKVVLEFQSTAISQQLTQSAAPVAVSPTVAPPTAIAPTEVLPTVPPATIPPAIIPPTTEPPSVSPSINWTVDSTGVCRNDLGGYPRWSEYNWTLSQCEQACQNNPNCQGFAMSKGKNYCQLFGSDGQYEASKFSAQITRGDRAHPDYTCYLKSGDQSIFNWIMDSTGVCRNDAGGYPRWSEYNWTLSQCEQACQSNPNCQGFAMSKEKNYCQLFGSDGQYDGNGTGLISRGDSSYPQYTCYIKR